MQNRLTLLGPVGLTVASGASSRRASQQRRMALLAVLAAASDGSVSRDRLLGLLWPDRDERTARHLLADSLYVLRRTLGDDAIVAAGDSVRLSPDLVWSDVAEFRRALSEERWADSLVVYRGDFLDGFYVRNAADFELWTHTERTRLRDLAARAASTLAVAREKAGDTTEAVAAAERALELAPIDERLFRELVRLLILTENRARAEAVARGFTERVALEVGVTPSVETMRSVRSTGALAHSEPIVVVPPTNSRGGQGRARTIDSTTAAIIVQARYQWYQRTPAAVERAIDYFTRAAERDQRAVDAWCGLADSWIVMGGRGYAPLSLAMDRVLDSVQRAVAIDDSLSAVHTSIGGLNILRRRWGEAEAALRRAIELDPHNANARHWLTLALITGFRDHAAAMREQTISVRLDPAAAIQMGALGLLQYLRGEYELSRSTLETAFHLNADLEEGHGGLARVAARLGDETTAFETISASITRRGDLRADLLAEHGSALAVLGDVRRARQLLDEATARGAQPLHLALAWGSVGDGNRAFEALDRDSLLRYWSPQAIWWDPRLDVIRGDPRFKKVLRRVDDAWRPSTSS